jgi:hypothetical protein
MIDDMNKKEAECNVVILPEDAKKNDNDVVEFSKVELDENNKIAMKTSVESQRYEFIFEDDPIITVPESPKT